MTRSVVGDCVQNGIFFRTDVGPHFYDCSVFLQKQVAETKSDERAWQWVILAAVAVIQSATVLFLSERSSHDLELLDRKSFKEWFEVYDGKKGLEEIAPLKMEGSISLIKQARKNSELDVTDYELEQFRRIIRLRNDFVHFLPKAWSIKISALPKMVELCAKYAIQIIDNPGMYAFNRLDANLRTEAESRLKTVIAELKSP